MPRWRRSSSLVLAPRMPMYARSTASWASPRAVRQHATPLITNFSNAYRYLGMPRHPSEEIVPCHSRIGMANTTLCRCALVSITLDYDQTRRPPPSEKGKGLLFRGIPIHGSLFVVSLRPARYACLHRQHRKETQKHGNRVF